MDRPTWVTVIGVLMVIFGVLGIFGSGQLMFMPKMMEWQQSVMGKAMEQAQQKNPDSKEIIDELQKMWDMPDSTKTTIMIMGFISLLVTGFYLFAGISLLQMKANAIKIAYWALGVSMGFTFLQAMFAMSTSSIFGMFLIIGGVVSLTIDTVLLLVIILNDKTPFTQTDPRASIPIS